MEWAPFASKRGAQRTACKTNAQDSCGIKPTIWVVFLFSIFEGPGTPIIPPHFLLLQFLRRGRAQLTLNGLINERHFYSVISLWFIDKHGTDLY